MPDYEFLLKKLEETLTKVSGLEKESIEYKIEKIKEHKLDFDNNFNISTAKLISSEHLINKIKKERNLIIGYRKLIDSDNFLYKVVKDKLDLAKLKVLQYEKLIDKCAPIFKSKFEKVTGSVRFDFLKMEFDPIFEIKKLKFYVDLTLKLIYDLSSVDNFIEIVFEYASELEIFLVGNSDVILGSILIPCDFFIDKENSHINIDFENFNYISTKITFKKEIKLIRKNAGVVCVYKNGHGLEALPTYSPKICGVCSNFLPLFTNHYSCFKCKFSCHKKCSDTILFKCKSDSLESFDTTKEPFKNNYGITHILNEFKSANFNFCNHCGERISEKIDLQCTRCDSTFHFDCKQFVFDSCLLDLELRIKMSKFIPKQYKLNVAAQTIKIADFELIRTLGQGNFGKVILSRYKNTNEVVALKVIKKDQMNCENEAKYLDIERKVAKLGTQCKHPFLMHLLYCFQDNKNVYLATEYLSGGDLFHHTLKREFTHDNIKLYACEILIGLDFLHKNEIIYRDLKLDNILLTEEGHVKLCDFGLCKENIGPASYTHTFCGTLDTMAPEVILNKGYTNLVDLWSYGVVLYELYTKTPPFSGTTNREISRSILNSNPVFPNSIPEDAKDLIKRLLIKDPVKRIKFHDVKNHDYFKDTNWNDIFNLKIVPDFKPGRNIYNFDAEFTDDLILLPEGNDEKRFDKFFENFK